MAAEEKDQSCEDRPGETIIGTNQDEHKNASESQAQSTDSNFSAACLQSEATGSVVQVSQDISAHSSVVHSVAAGDAPSLQAPSSSQNMDNNSGFQVTSYDASSFPQSQPEGAGASVNSDPTSASANAPPNIQAPNTDGTATASSVIDPSTIQAAEYYQYYQYYGVPPTVPANYAYMYPQYGQLPGYPAASTAQAPTDATVPTQVTGSTPLSYPAVGAAYPYGTHFMPQVPLPGIQPGVQVPPVKPDSNSVVPHQELSNEAGTGGDSDEDPTVLKGKHSTKKSNTLPFRGDEKTMNLNNLIYTNIIQSPYFKNDLYALKTYHEVIDEIYREVRHLEPWERGSRRIGGQTGMCGSVRGVGAGGIVSTAYCCLYKLYTLKLTRKQLNGLIKHKDSPYIRGLGFMYIRYTQPPQDFWSWYEPFLTDEEQVDVKAGGGQIMSIGEMCRHMLQKLDWFSTLFPRIPVPVQKDIAKKLQEYDENMRKERGVEDGEIEEDEEQAPTDHQEKDLKGVDERSSRGVDKRSSSRPHERSIKDSPHHHGRDKRPSSPVRDVKERNRDRDGRDVVRDRDKDRDRHRDHRRRSRSVERDPKREHHHHHDRRDRDVDRDRTKRHRSETERDREKGRDHRERDRDKERHKRSRSRSHERHRRKSRSRSKEKHSSSKHSHREAHGHKSRH